MARLGTSVSRRCQSFILLVASLIADCLPTVAAANGQNGVYFIFPTGGEVFHYQDVVNVTYSTPFDTPALFTWCGTDGGGVRGVRSESIPPMSGFALIPLNFTSSTSCWFNIRPSLDSPAGNGGNSYGFSILETQRQATTVGLKTETVTSQTATSQTATASPDAATTSTDTSKSSPTSGSVVKGGSNNATGSDSQPAALDTGAIVAISIGSAIVLTILGGAAVAVCLAKRKGYREASAGRRRCCMNSSGRGWPWQKGGSGSTEKLCTISSGHYHPYAGEYAPAELYDKRGTGGSDAQAQNLCPNGYTARITRFAVAQLSVPDFQPPDQERHGRAASSGDLARTRTETMTTSDSGLSQTAVSVAAPIALTPSPVGSWAVARAEAAELPTKDDPSWAWGCEQEMPVPRPPPIQQPVPRPGFAEPPSQKFLLQDVAFLKISRYKT